MCVGGGGGERERESMRDLGKSKLIIYYFL